MTEKALVQVLGAVAYGELQAYEGCKVRAAEATDPEERRAWMRQASQELRHYRGFVARLENLGADPERAMRPCRQPLDRFNANQPTDDLEAAVWGYLGEGMADDLMVWLRRVVDDETASFVDSVIRDEAEDEDRAAEELRALLDGRPEQRRLAAQAARRMVLNLLRSGRGGMAPASAFFRLGRPHELVGLIAGGIGRRLREIGVNPLAGVMPGVS
jgi:hypothetical protein